jgi:succinate dehydrogenase/fumarate reductase cytochrome b subunit
MLKHSRRALYLFFSALLGVMLFLIMHRVVVFFILLFSIDQGETVLGLSQTEFMALDYVTLMIVILFGAWYGIWLGVDWYEKVYESRLHGGLTGYLLNRFSLNQSRNLRNKISHIAQTLENEAWELEELAVEAGPVVPVKRKVVRKRTVRKKAAVNA